MKFAYLAGYIDGDGCMYAGTYLMKNGTKVFRTSLQISSTSDDMCKYFNTEFTGSFTKRPEKRLNRKPSWCWKITGIKSKDIISVCIPFLILKKTVAIFFVYLIQDVHKSITFRGKSLSKESIFHRNDLIKNIKQEIHMNDRVSEQLFESLKEIKKCKIPCQSDLAYFAGLIDAEGCFRIQHWKPKRKGRNETWVIALEIGNTKFPIFPWLIERFAGTCTYRKSSKATQNPMIIWSLKSNSLFQILPLIFPYLRVKKERCEKLGQFHQTGMLNGGDRHSSRFKTNLIDILQTRRKLFEEFQILNKKGNH